MVKQFVLDECNKSDRVVIEETLLSKSHRNNKQICDFSSAIYYSLPQSLPCDCPDCHPSDVEHQGIFIVKSSDVRRYVELYKPIQLRHSMKMNIQYGYVAYNYGQSKGKTFDRVIIYPTDKIKKWLFGQSVDMANRTRAGFYVAVTRARYSVAFVIPDKECSRIQGIELWNE